MSRVDPVIDAAKAAQLLGVDAACGEERLKAAFRASVKRAHPDRPGGDAERLRAVIEAYEHLRGRLPALAVADPRSAPPAILEITPTEALQGLKRPATTAEGQTKQARLPAGLRAGDRVRLGGAVLTVAIVRHDGLAVIGDHLCMSLTLEPGWLRQGATVRVVTPRGPRDVRITRQDALRGLARINGEGLPARGDRPAGDLLVRLTEAAAPEAYESPARAKLRRFTADWAA